MAALRSSTGLFDLFPQHGGFGGQIGAAAPSYTVHAPQITERMLEHDVFKVPADSLVDIWLLRFGNSWVNLDDIERDDFFKMAYIRLKSLGKLEVHYLTDRSRYVCRKPE